MRVGCPAAECSWAGGTVQGEVHGEGWGAAVTGLRFARDFDGVCTDEEACGCEAIRQELGIVAGEVTLTGNPWDVKVFRV